MRNTEPFTSTNAVDPMFEQTGLTETTRSETDGQESFSGLVTSWIHYQVVCRFYRIKNQFNNGLDTFCLILNLLNIIILIIIEQEAELMR